MSDLDYRYAPSVTMPCKIILLILLYAITPGKHLKCDFQSNSDVLVCVRFQKGVTDYPTAFEPEVELG
jgi:hypothetical protein